MPTGWVDAFFSLVLAATIVVSMQVVGVTLIAAAIVIPPVIARLLTHSFRKMLILSTALGAFCGMAGIYVSWYVDVSSGASVVLFAALIFLAILAYTTLRDRRRGKLATKEYPQDSDPPPPLTPIVPEKSGTDPTLLASTPFPTPLYPLITQTVAVQPSPPPRRRGPLFSLQP